MPHHHMQHTQNVWPNLFMRNENSAYIMPHVASLPACARHVKCIHGAPGITYGRAIHASRMIFIKNNHLTF